MEKVETKAILRSLRMSPQKVRLLVDLIRGMGVAEAKLQLQFSKKAAAKPVLKLLNSAIANATHNDSAKAETLVVTNAFVDGGPTFHRWMPRAMGRATPLRKRTSHITIVLSGEAEAKPKKEVIKENEIEAKVSNPAVPDKGTKVKATKKTTKSKK